MAVVSYALFRHNRKSPIFGKQAHPLIPEQMEKDRRNIDAIRRPVVGSSEPLPQHIEADLLYKGAVLKRLSGEDSPAVEQAAHRLAAQLKLEPAQYVVRLWVVVGAERYRVVR